MWASCRQDNLEAIKGDEVLMHTTAQGNLEKVAARERRQTLEPHLVPPFQ